MTTVLRFPLKYPIVKNPKILGGTPVIEGTRIPASLVLDLLKKGYSVNLIRTEYPSLSKEKLNAFFSLISKSFDASSTNSL